MIGHLLCARITGQLLILVEYLQCVWLGLGSLLTLSETYRAPTMRDFVLGTFHLGDLE